MKGYFYSSIQILVIMSAIRATRTTRSSRAPRTRKQPEQVYIPLTKKFTEDFKETVFANPLPVTDLKEYKENPKMFKIDEKNMFQAYCYSSNMKKLLFISTIKGSLCNKQFYHDVLAESDLPTSNLCCETEQTYFLIYKSDKEYVIYWYNYAAPSDEQFESPELYPNLLLTDLSNWFADANLVINDEKLSKIILNKINEIYKKYSLQPKSRTLFLNLAFILLRRDDIPFTWSKNNEPISLSKYLRLSKIQGIEPKNKSSKEWQTWRQIEDIMQYVGEKIDSCYQHGTIHPLLEAFERIATLKETFQEQNKSKWEKEYTAQQTKQFKSMFDELSTKRFEHGGLELIATINDEIYSKFKASAQEFDLTLLHYIEKRFDEINDKGQRKSNGETMTPSIIKELILRLLPMPKDGDKCYDPTCGVSGGFAEAFTLRASSRMVENFSAYGCELQPNLATNAWINAIGFKQDFKVFNDDCFSHKIKQLMKPDDTPIMDYLLMNPPYLGARAKVINNLDWEENEYMQFHVDKDGNYRKGKEYKNDELTFCRYNLEFLKEGGWFAFIVPISTVNKCTNTNSLQYEHKKALLENNEIWYIIKLNGNVFKPIAITACIIIGRKCRPSPEWKTKCIDFSEDGGYTKPKIVPRLYNKEQFNTFVEAKILDKKETEGMNINYSNPLESVFFYEPETGNDVGKDYYVERILTPEMNWVFTKYEFKSMPQMMKKYHLDMLRREFEIRKAEIENHDYDIDYVENEGIEWKSVKLGESILDLVGHGNVKVANELKEGEYNLVSASAKLNGVVQKIDFYDYDASEEHPYITISTLGDGVFIQTQRFAASTAVLVCKPKENINLSIEDWERVLWIINTKLDVVHNYSERLSLELFGETSCELPFDGDGSLAPSLCKVFETDDWRIKWKDVPVTEIFDIVSPVKTIKMSDVKPGPYPMISRGEQYNGIIHYVDKYTYEGDDYVTFATDGTAGFCTVQTGKFCLYDHPPGLLKLKSEYSYLKPVLNQIAFAMTQYLTVKYNYSERLGLQDMKTEIIPQLPFVTDLEDSSKELIDVSTVQCMFCITPIKYYLPISENQQKADKATSTYDKIMNNWSSKSSTAATTSSNTAVQSDDDDDWK